VNIVETMRDKKNVLNKSCMVLRKLNNYN